MKPEMIEKIKKLREITNFSICDCAKALTKTQGNIEEAIELLNKEKYIEYPEIFDEPLTEGATHVACNKNKAVIFELNIKTDFAAQNIQFIELITTIEKILLQVPDSIRKLNDFLNYNFQGKTVKQIISQKMTIFQEQIRLKRIQIVYKKTEESFGYYKHQNGKISTLIHLTKPCKNVEKHLPIHITESNPKSKEILLQQEMYNNSKIKVQEYLQKNNTNIIVFYRFALNN
ncbi:MAG: translation elongation factor Ts [Sweet potato little leaf phytoplasma]|uniref:Elongation factor Ts n=2 Tax=Candidatus Phytoplasma TaxID=33926 RepID=A0ABN0J7S2_PEWBP|nr:MULTISPECIES: translation elongation factor Ts [Phytoplasma]MDV3139140.1 translation elongation factor Ts [Candidatus Phytoplasma australasiaticum]QLL37072.1 elongation factor Ts ['Echinacea purpurea' witches'-broom phytoplasma]WEX20617.1 MAG: elongation factor Ts [Candidatus Phytoplasma aurantifolia]EMR14511.1 elongation factor Ts [Peanut witches'-broom phytoplasma NTU2011]MDO7987080.1 translation elongation factor Ts [Sweet potato little leaf phytoplasma]